MNELELKKYRIKSSLSMFFEDDINDLEYEKIVDGILENGIRYLNEYCNCRTGSIPYNELEGYIICDLFDCEISKDVVIRIIDSNLFDFDDIDIYQDFYTSIIESLSEIEQSNFTVETVIFTIFDYFAMHHNYMTKKIKELYGGLFYQVYKQSIINDYLGIVEEENINVVKVSNKEEKPNKFVYIATGLVKGQYKIGMTREIKQREESLKLGNPDLIIFAYMESKNAFKIEKEIHKKYSNKSIGREWFVLSDDDINSLIKEYNFRYVDIQS